MSSTVCRRPVRVVPAISLCRRHPLLNRSTVKADKKLPFTLFPLNIIYLTPSTNNRNQGIRGVKATVHSPGHLGPSLSLSLLSILDDELTLHSKSLVFLAIATDFFQTVT